MNHKLQAFINQTHDIHNLNIRYTDVQHHNVVEIIKLLTDNSLSKKLCLNRIRFENNDAVSRVINC